MKVTQYLAVNGTHENREKKALSWSNPESELSKYLERHALLNIADSAMLPYDWSNDLDLRDHSDQKAGGRALFYYVVPPLRPEYAWPPDETVVVTHSFGINVAIEAAALGLKIDRLLDIAGPVRKDWRKRTEQARPNIRRWMHVHSDRSDKWQWLGTLFDGHFGIVREHPLADKNVAIPKVGHGGILRQPKLFHHWADKGLINFLKTGEV